MDKEDTMEYYSATKKNEIMPFAATWMQLEMIILSEVCQKEKNKYRRERERERESERERERERARERERERRRGGVENRNGGGRNWHPGQPPPPRPPQHKQTWYAAI